MRTFDRWRFRKIRARSVGSDHSDARQHASVADRHRLLRGVAELGDDAPVCVRSDTDRARVPATEQTDSRYGPLRFTGPEPANLFSAQWSSEGWATLRESEATSLHDSAFYERISATRHSYGGVPDFHIGGVCTDTPRGPLWSCRHWGKRLCGASSDSQEGTLPSLWTTT